MTQQQLDIADFILNLLQFLIVLSGIVWAYIRLKRERTHTPHIEFSINCTFFGPEQDHYLAEFILSASNKGLIIHKFQSIKLRIRGISHNTLLEYWPNGEKRVAFPIKVLPAIEVVSKKYEYVFVEPGVKQDIPYTTKIPTSCKYIAVHAIFEYGEYPDHSTEKIFEVPSKENNHI